MTTSEVIATLISSLAALISCVAAYYARGSERAAKVQAQAAKTEATVTVKARAESRIQIAIQYRRVIADLGRLVAEARQAASIGADGTRRNETLQAIEVAERALEDMPPYFPKQVLSAVTAVLDLQQTQRPEIASGQETPAQMARLRDAHIRASRAIQAMIEEQRAIASQS